MQDYKNWEVTSNLWITQLRQWRLGKVANGVGLAAILKRVVREGWYCKGLHEGNKVWHHTNLSRKGLDLKLQPALNHNPYEGLNLKLDSYHDPCWHSSFPRCYQQKVRTNLAPIKLNWIQGARFSTMAPPKRSRSSAIPSAWSVYWPIARSCYRVHGRSLSCGHQYWGHSAVLKFSI